MAKKKPATRSTPRTVKSTSAKSKAKAIRKATAKAKSPVKPRTVPGTVIDDSAALVKLAACLKASPDLSVSEAVRKIGIGDSASIRRLRGKYSKLPATRRSPKLNAKTKARAGARAGTTGRSAPKSKSARTGTTRTAPKAAVALSTQSKRTRKSEKTFATAKPVTSKSAKAKVKGKPPTSSTAKVQAKPARAATQAKQNNGNTNKTASQSAGPSADMASSISPWMTGGLSLSSSLMHSQIQLYQQAMKLAPVESLVKQQFEFSKTLLSMFSTMPLNMNAGGGKK